MTGTIPWTPYRLKTLVGTIHRANSPAGKKTFYSWSGLSSTKDHKGGDVPGGATHPIHKPRYRAEHEQFVFTGSRLYNKLSIVEPEAYSLIVLFSTKYNWAGNLATITSVGGGHWARERHLSRVLTGVCWFFLGTLGGLNTTSCHCLPSAKEFNKRSEFLLLPHSGQVFQGRIGPGTCRRLVRRPGHSYLQCTRVVILHFHCEAHILPALFTLDLMVNDRGIPSIQVVRGNDCPPKMHTTAINLRKIVVESLFLESQRKTTPDHPHPPPTPTKHPMKPLCLLYGYSAAPENWALYGLR